MDPSSHMIPVVDNANMFQDEFLLYDGCNLGGKDDGSMMKIERGDERGVGVGRHIPEKSGSDCTSVDGGGSRDDSTDEGGDDATDAAIIIPHSKEGANFNNTTQHTYSDNNRQYLHGQTSPLLSIPGDGSIYGNNFHYNDGNVNMNDEDNIDDITVIESIDNYYDKNHNIGNSNNYNNNNNNNKKKRSISKSVTEDQKVERRDRNREHAKRSRLRKKSMLKSLQSSLEALQRQNNKLKMAITDKVEDAEQIIKVEINNIHASHCPPGQSHKSLLEESQRRFLVRVETDVDLISSLLN